MAKRSKEQIVAIFYKHNEVSGHFEDRLNIAYNGLVDMHSAIWFKDKKQLLTRLSPNYKVIIKEVASVMSLEWLEKNYPSDLLFVLRHPCSVALSEFERQIDGKKSLEYLLENENLYDLFTEEERSIFKKASKPFEYYGLIWSIRNKPYSKLIAEGKQIFTIHYESLAEKPVEEFEAIFKHFYLNWTKEVENYIIENTNKESKGHYKTTKNAKKHIDRWKTELTDEQINQVKEFTLPFELGFYDENSFNY